MITQTIQREKLISILKLIKAGLGVKSKRAKSTICEITFTDNKIDIAIPGAKFTVKTNGLGVAKVTLPFLYFYDIIDKTKNTVIEICIEKNQMSIGSLNIGVNTTFLQDDKILRTIQLPLNYSDKDLILLKNGKYTPEELHFNGLSAKIEKAEEQLKTNIERTFQMLKMYGLSKKEIFDFVWKKINIQQKTID